MLLYGSDGQSDHDAIVTGDRVGLGVGDLVGDMVGEVVGEIDSLIQSITVTGNPSRVYASSPPHTDPMYISYPYVYAVNDVEL